jgi:hypothetical protein
MPKIALVLLLGAAVAATCVLLMWQTGGSTIFGGNTEREEFEEKRGNELTAPRLDAGPTPPRTRAPLAGQDEEPRAGTTDDVVLTVNVLDDETGGPISRATLTLETSQAECPRLVVGAMRPPDLGFFANRGVDPMQAGRLFETDREGRLAFLRDHIPPGDVFDVFAQARGWVLGAACKVHIPGQTTIRLKRGISLRGRVTTLQGKPLADAHVAAQPGAGTPALPGHAGWAPPTDEQGQFEIDGLLAGPLRVTVQRAGFWPLVLESEDPKEPRERTYVLQPAFTLKFRLRTNDGREIVNPTLQAHAPLAQPPFTTLKILKLLDDKNADGQLTEGVMVPATLGTVALELKAEGYAPWRSPAEPVPPEGGERILPVTLDRDAGQGGLRITFEDERGKRLKYVELRALPPSIMALERQDLGGGIVYEQADDLRFPALPPGKYRFGIRAFAYAPDTFDTVVVGGTESEHRVAFRLAARLRVKFTAPTARMVRFRILQNGRPVPALPEEGETKPTDPPLTDEPVLSAGEAGALLGGLASGTYVVEVISEDLQPTRTPVTVREGETEEIEIRVTPK